MFCIYEFGILEYAEYERLGVNEAGFSWSRWKSYPAKE